jgi:hypothetical protein
MNTQSHLEHNPEHILLDGEVWQKEERRHCLPVRIGGESALELRALNGIA